MCKLCDQGRPQLHQDDDWHGKPRRGFLQAGVAAGATGLFAAAAAAEGGDEGDPQPGHSGRHDRRLLIRGGAVMSIDPAVGDFGEADVLVEGRKIVAVGKPREIWRRAHRRVTLFACAAPARNTR